MLRKLRILLAALFFTLLTLLFVDVSGLLHHWLSWMAMLQFWPAVLACHFGVVAALVVLTLVFGRIYCSVICPLGVMQDVVSHLHTRRQKNRFRYSPERRVLRYSMLALFLVAFAAGAGSLVALLSPYSAYGRIAENLLAPLWALGNNGLAYLAERVDSYAFYHTDVWVKSLPTFAVAVVTFVVVAVLAWRGGRTYCNTICPVGTLLSFAARFAWLRVRIDTSKCNSCGLCARNCKAACIDTKAHRVDYSRCVACGNCVDRCHRHALSYGAPLKTRKAPEPEPAEKSLAKGPANPSRRAFLVGGTLATATAVWAQEKKKVDGGLAILADKQVPLRHTPLTPPGSLSASNMARRCTACQLCVSKCPNGVLRPSTDLLHLMQPIMSYERGYCRPECTRCADVCPTGAIQPITREEKSAIHIGHAVWVSKNCIPLTDGVECGNCARHCPTGAILMISSDPQNPAAPKIPAVNPIACIGCGACEHLCPARPLSAIYVEGNEAHIVG